MMTHDSFFRAGYEGTAEDLGSMSGGISEASQVFCTH